jgi:branched-chain amino acid transport system substrate-binding protein
VTPLPRTAIASPRCAAGLPAPAATFRIALRLLLPAAAVACSRANTAVEPAGVFAIGVGAVPGKPGYSNAVRGVELAVERLNETGATRFQVRLPAKSATRAVTVAEALQQDASVIGVVGHPQSGESMEALPVYADAAHGGANGVAMVSPTASSPRLTGISPWFFRVAPSDDAAARFVARWTLDSLGARRAAVIYRNDSYGRDWSSTFATAFRAGAGVIVSRDPYLPGLTEWEAYALMLARLKPDVLLFPGDAGDAVELLRALADAGVKVTFVGGDGTGAMASAPEAQGARYVAFFSPDRATSPEGESFMNRYRARFKEDPDMFAALSYDAALAIGKSVVAGARTRADLRSAIERIGSGTPAIDGAGGSIAFGKNHDAAGRTLAVTTIGNVP